MSLVVTSRVASDVVVVDVSGRLCFLQVSLREHINKLVDKGHRDFVLNLSDVPYIDSFGLGELISIGTAIRSAGGHLALLRPTDYVQQLFEITKLNTVFDIAREEAAAIKSAKTNVADPDLSTSISSSIA